MAAYTRLWQAADKVVYSSSLDSVTTARTTLERTFDPEVVRHMKNAASGDLSVGGPTVIVGGGTRALPDDVHIELKLVTEHRFTGGVVFLHYRAV